MKALFFLLTLQFLLFVLVPARAQTPTSSMIPVLEEAKSKLLQIEGTSSKLVHIEFEYMKDNKYYGMTYQKLYTHHTYKIVAFGDPQRFANIDVYVDQYVNNEWQQIAGDSSSSREGYISIQPPTNDYVRIRIDGNKLYSDYTDGYYGIIIYY